MKKLLFLLGLCLMTAAAPLHNAQDAKPGSDEAKPISPNPEAKPPAEQPKSGPGGAEYAHKKVEMVTGGKGAKKYWLYTPAEPAPKQAPVIMLVHGFGATDPERTYIGWIEHLVMRGNIVLFPIYQETALEPTDNYAPNCAESFKLAMEHLEGDKSRVQPLKEKFAIVGHSAGGMTTGNLAAQWEELGLPKPLAAMPVQPGRAFGYSTANQRDNGMINLADFSKIPRETHLLCVYGDSDQTVGSYCAIKIFAGATGVPAENKNLIEVRSCVHGSPKMIATHQTPGALRNAGQDAFDWFGYWKLFDALTDTAFHGKHRDYALGDTEKQRFMGRYSDGCALCQMQVTLGNAKLDPDTVEYTPAYERNGKPVAQPKAEAPKAPPKPAERREQRPEERKDRRREDGPQDESEEEF